MPHHFKHARDQYGSQVCGTLVRFALARLYISRVSSPSLPPRKHWSSQPTHVMADINGTFTVSEKETQLGLNLNTFFMWSILTGTFNYGHSSSHLIILLTHSKGDILSYISPRYTFLVRIHLCRDLTIKSDTLVQQRKRAHSRFVITAISVLFILAMAQTAIGLYGANWSFIAMGGTRDTIFEAVMSHPPVMAHLLQNITFFWFLHCSRLAHGASSLP